LNAITKGQPGFDGDPAREYKLRDPEGDGKRELTTTRRVDRLQWLHDEGHIDAAQFEAGDNLRSDWERCRIGGASISWDNIGASRRPFTGLSDHTCRALDAFGAAWASIPFRCRTPIGYVALENHSKLRAAALLHTHHRTILPFVLVALDALAEHYGLTFTAPLAMPNRKW
jgi:hypothetical protein